jgi:hypothetical protein
MQECPKCSARYDDDLKICRTCGAILAAATSDPPQQPANSDLSPHDEEAARPTDSTEQAPWTCPECGQSVPDTFEVCWNCGTSRDGVPDLAFSKEPSSGDSDHPWEAEAPEQAVAASRPTRQCPKCGSSKIIPNMRILDPGAYSAGKIEVVVDGNPNAMIFKDSLYGRVTADTCGECGHVELKAQHPSELYEHYLRSTGPQGG